MDQQWLQSSHRRWSPLKGEWVLVSPHRTQRPWQGQLESVGTVTVDRYDSQCYLCPGNVRTGGVHTPRYLSTFVFENDFAALCPADTNANYDEGALGLLRAQTERGICRVLCFDPRHDLTLATMETSGIRHVVDVWRQQAHELGSCGDFQYVQIFENRGTMMGSSNPHPHGQIWATEHIPNEPLAELQSQRAYFDDHKSPLLADYLRLETEKRERVVLETDEWCVLVPFWAVWPFETLLLPKRTAARLEHLSDRQCDGLASALKQLTGAYNRVFDTPFPYSMGFHPAPYDGNEHPEWTLHAHFYPPLLRSATVRKFMVGFELLGSPQRDITPESAAETLRRAINSQTGESK